MNLTINVSEELYRRAAEVAAMENVSVEELFAAAFEERVLEFERLKERAAKGSYEKFRRVMAKIPAVEPPEYDRLRLAWCCQDPCMTSTRSASAESRRWRPALNSSPRSLPKTTI